MLPALTCVLRELRPAARQAAPGRFHVAAPEQSRGHRSHMQKEKSQEEPLHPAGTWGKSGEKLGKKDGCNSGAAVAEGSELEFASAGSLASFKRQELASTPPLLWALCSWPLHM